MEAANMETKDESDATRLTEFEDGALQTGANPPSSITWFSGGNHQSAAVVLQQRLELVLNKNPWLTGRIAKRDDGHNYLEYSNTATAVPNEMFRHVTHQDNLVTVSKTTPYCRTGKSVGRCWFDASIWT